MLTTISCIITALIITTVFKFYCRQYVVSLNKIYISHSNWKYFNGEKILILVMDLCRSPTILLKNNKKHLQ